MIYNGAKHTESVQKAAKSVLVVGRWQPFHLGHLRLLRSAFRLGERVIIAIGSSNESRTARNPLTAKERAEMIRRVLSAEGVEKERYTIVPVRDFGNDVLWLGEAERTCLPGKFDMVMSGNLHTARIFRKAGYKVVRPRFFRKKECNATHIRSLIHKGEKWEHLVPKLVLEYLEERNLVEVIRKSGSIVQHGSVVCECHRGEK